MFHHFPTQDGSSHVYNAHVLKEYHRHENYTIRDVYRLNLTLFPNWASHALLAGLLYLLPPIVCEKIVVSLCVAGLPLSLLYFLRAIDRRNALLALVGFPFAYHYLLQMGFYNFALSVPMFFFALGYWWSRKDAMRMGHWSKLYGMVLVTYLCHAQSFLLLVASLSLLAAYDRLRAIIAEGKRPGSQWVDSAWRELTSLIGFVGMMTPIYFIAASYYLANALGANRDYWTREEYLDYFWGFRSLVYFRDDHSTIGRCFLALFGALLLFAIASRIRLALAARHASSGHRTLDGTEAFLGLACVATALYFTSPWSLGPGGWINDRIHLYIFLLLLPFLQTYGMHQLAKAALACGIVALSVWHLVYSAHAYQHMSVQIDEMVAGVGELEPHSTVRLAEPVWDGPEQRTGDHVGEIKYVSPFLFVSTYAMVEARDVAFLTNYEASLDYFPVNYRPGWGDPENVDSDYILAWRLNDHQLEELVREQQGKYSSVRQGRYSQLFRRIAAPVDMDVWNDEHGVHFDMEPDGGPTAAGHIAIRPDTAYEDGRFGWLNRAGRIGRQREGINQPLLGDAIESRRDGVFRVALPNGRYRVAVHASSQARLHVIANDQYVIKGATVHDVADPLTYDVVVQAERLTQVIYAQQAREPWQIAGMTIVRLE